MRMEFVTVWHMMFVSSLPFFPNVGLVISAQTGTGLGPTIYTIVKKQGQKNI